MKKHPQKSNDKHATTKDVINNGLKCATVLIAAVEDGLHLVEELLKFFR